MKKDLFCFIGAMCYPFLLALVICSLAGCDNNNTPYYQQQLITKAFTNQRVQLSQVKATSCYGQYIVKCDDGSVWEIKVDGLNGINYKNCLFDPLDKLPLPPLEKDK